MEIETLLGKYQADVDTALSKMAEEKIVQRIWEHDHTVWKPEPDEISNRLGWLHLPENMRSNFEEIQSVVQAVRQDGYTHVLLLGMGGSSLASEVFSKTFGAADGFLQLNVLDSTDPGAVVGYAEQLDLSKTLLIVATKSGGTVETLSFFKYFYNCALETMSADEVGKHFIAITDPGSKLVDLGERYKFRHIFKNDPDLGGRFSALSFFGLVPAALLGVDLSTLLDNAGAMMQQCHAETAENPGAQLGAVLAELAKAGSDKITLLTSPTIGSFGDWVEQLIAESTGKDGKGILPVVGEQSDAAQVYGDDRLFVAVELEGEPVNTGALEAAGQPVVRLKLDDVYDLGGQFFLWEFATAITGHGLGIQPFNQPNVESAKVLARQMVSAYKEDGVLPEGNTSEVDSQTLLDFLETVKTGDYIAIQAYVTPTAETTAALSTLRILLREKHKLATTVGYGPRFLHSTGQLHKGDGGNGLFIQFVSQTEQNVATPNEAGQEASDMSFGVLKQAQALGDAQALRDAGRRVISFSISKDTATQISKLVENLA